jgi:hypothetical protein
MDNLRRTHKISETKADHGLHKNISKKDKRQRAWSKQRKERGFDDTETWAMDQAFAKFILPRLQRFKEVHICYPPDLTMKKWDNIIQQMIDGFEEILRRDEKIADWDVKKVDKGLKLFAKWYHDLWW